MIHTFVSLQRFNDNFSKSTSLLSNLGINAVFTSLQRQLALDDLPFTCGLYQVCCSLGTTIGSHSTVSTATANTVGTGAAAAGGLSCGKSSGVTLSGRISAAGQTADGDAEFGEINEIDKIQLTL